MTAATTASPATPPEAPPSRPRRRSLRPRPVDRGLASARRDRSTRVAGPPRVSPFLLWGFHGYVRRYLRKRFDAIRLARGSEPELPDDHALVVYLNHPGWYDPLVGAYLADRLWGGRQHFAPIDAAMLDRYQVFSKLGFYGVHRSQRRGGLDFIRTSLAILDRSDRAVWVTAQGRFTDVRSRPVRLSPGLSHLAPRLARAVVVPLAVEYAFWNESRPEVLLRFGEPMHAGGEATEGWDPGRWHRELESRLERCMDRLAEDAMSRDASRFTTLLDGSRGVGGLYDAIRACRSWLRGERFDASHERAADSAAREQETDR